MKTPSDDLDLPSVEQIHRWAAWREILHDKPASIDTGDIEYMLFEAAGPITLDFYYDEVWERTMGSDPAGRAIPTPAYPNEWTDPRVLLEHSCQLQHAQFYLPEGVPVPTLRWTPQDIGEGREREVTRLTIHPSLAIGGAEAIRAHLRSSAEQLRLKAAQLLIQAREREALCDAPLELPQRSGALSHVRAQTNGSDTSS